MNLEETLQQGVAAARAGRTVEARELLMQVIEADETRLEAWLWLSRVVDSLEDKVVCLENVLTLDPDHSAAQTELAEVKSHQAALFKPVYAPGEEVPPASVAPDLAKITAITATDPYQDEFDNEWLCPYCARLTQPADRVCPHCRRPLIISKRVKPERSAWLWRGILLQAAAALYLIVFGIVYAAVFARLNGIPDPIPFWPLYFGRPVEQPPDLVEKMLDIFPRLAFWSLMGAALYSLGMLIILFLRVQYGNVVYLINAGLMVVLGLLTLLFWSTTQGILILGVIGLMVGLAQLAITLQIWPDFTFKETRLTLKIDSGAKNHTSLYLSGREYGQRGMWGKAVIHLRRAVARKPENLSYHIALIVAYLNIRRDDLARRALDQAEKLAPQAPQIKQLRDKMSSFIRSR